MENMELMSAEMAIELADKGIKVAKQIETIIAIDQAMANKVAYELRNKKEKMDDRLDTADKVAGLLREYLPEAVAEVDKLLAGLIFALGKETADIISAIKEEALKPRGSKVKAGQFQGCRIVYAGSKSYILIPVGNIGPVMLYLTPECVKFCRYDRKKYNLSKLKNYYYYEIIFKDGSESYVRVSEKHRKNLECCGLQTTTETIFQALSPGEDDEDDE